MNFKLNKVALAVAGAVGAAGISGQASALDASVYTPANTLDVYLSGASAQDGSIRALMRRLCAPGTLDEYTGNTQRIFFCAVNTTQVGGLAKPNIAVRKWSAGGSGSGVQPVANATDLLYMEMGLIAADNAALCGATSSVAAVPPSAPDTIGLPAYTTRDCGNNYVGTGNAPDGGFSDVEPALFGATTAEVNNLNVVSANMVIFSISASKGLRDALQAAQGLTVGADDEANMPSLSKEVLTGIMSGGIASWDQVGLNNTAGSNNAFLVRRVPSSGTETFAEAYFLKEGCLPGVATMLTGNDPAAATDGLGCGTNVNATVFEGSSGSDVRQCLGVHDGNGNWAIGILTTQDDTPSATSATWRTIAIDGAAPTQLNVWKNAYDYWSEQTMQWRSTTNPATGDTLTFLNTVATQLSNPAIIAELAKDAQHPWAGVGETGLMGLALNFIPPAPTPTAAQLALNPIPTATRSPTGNTNNCQPPIVLHATSANN